MARFPTKTQFVARLTKDQQAQVNYLKEAMGLRTNQDLLSLMIQAMMLTAEKVTADQRMAVEGTAEKVMSMEQTTESSSSKMTLSSATANAASEVSDV